MGNLLSRRFAWHSSFTTTGRGIAGQSTRANAHSVTTVGECIRRTRVETANGLARSKIAKLLLGGPLPSVALKWLLARCAIREKQSGGLADHHPTDEYERQRAPCSGEKGTTAAVGEKAGRIVAQEHPRWRCCSRMAMTSPLWSATSPSRSAPVRLLTGTPMRNTPTASPVTACRC